ncbi:hypothetical protein HYN59_05265 [Flavobacterium album]|uniref:Uncharacterized protein n=1 Tax=Flavobacterium album TaxID=2175091 RepID=A0A2S1QW13_9FLAO|nr:hypothetical protein [Flavobacterium album]AWH84563.1 hypothetical protein HYN59_05265 [Flavobacterium album]
MKKIFTVLCMLALYAGQAQVPLFSTPLDLKRGTDQQQSLAATDTAYSQFAVFISDKESLKALRLNGALFFKDSLTTTRPVKDYDFMPGYSFTDGKPAVYWASRNLKKLQGVYFDFANRVVGRANFEMPYAEDEEVLTTFSEYEAFYIVTLPHGKEELKCYIFSNGTYTTKTIDFSALSFTDAKSKKTTLNNLIGDYPLQKIETNGFTDLPTSSQKIKLYALKDSFLLTLDHNPGYTQILTIDNANYTVTSRVFTHSVLADSADANSFYLDGKLYQIKLNNEEMAMTATSLSNTSDSKNYHVTAEEAIDFKNSPLLSQTGSNRPDELKDTKKFLRRAGFSGAAISVYRTPDDILITAGGVRTIMPAGDVILGAAGLLLTGGGNLFEGGELQVNYFESLFDDNFNHRPYVMPALAIDYIGRFMGGNRNLTLQTVTPFKGSYILGFYDTKTKRYLLRKFDDDFAY